MNNMESIRMNDASLSLLFHIVLTFGVMLIFLFTFKNEFNKHVEKARAKKESCVWSWAAFRDIGVNINTNI